MNKIIQTIKTWFKKPTKKEPIYTYETIPEFIKPFEYHAIGIKFLNINTETTTTINEYIKICIKEIKQ